MGKDFLIVRGSANKTGFEILAKSGKDKINLQTKNYKESESLGSLASTLCIILDFSITATFILFFFAVVYYAKNNFGNVFWGGTIFSLPILLLMVIAHALMQIRFFAISTVAKGVIVAGFTVYIIIGKENAQWHACEHKVVNLLVSDAQNLSIENLKKTSRFSAKCGSMAKGPLVLCSFLIAIESILIFLGTIDLSRPPIIAIVLMALYSVPVCLSALIQYYLATKEPENWQLEQAFEVVKRFESIRNNLKIAVEEIKIHS